MSKNMDIQNIFETIITQGTVEYSFSSYKKDNIKIYSWMFDKYIVSDNLKNSESPEEFFNNVFDFSNAYVDFGKHRTDDYLKQMALALKNLQDLRADNKCIRLLLTEYRKCKSTYAEYSEFIDELNKQDDTKDITLEDINKYVSSIKLPTSVVNTYSEHMHLYKKISPVKSRQTLLKELKLVIDIYNAENATDNDKLKELLTGVNASIEQYHKLRLLEKGIKLNDDLQLVDLEEYLKQEEVGTIYNTTKYIDCIVTYNKNDSATVSKEVLPNIIELVDYYEDNKNTTDTEKLQELIKYLKGNEYTVEDWVIRLEDRYKNYKEIENKNNEIANKVLKQIELTQEDLDFLTIGDLEDYIPRYLNGYLKEYAHTQFTTISKYDLKTNADIIKKASKTMLNVTKTTEPSEITAVINEVKGLEGNNVYSLILLDLVETEFFLKEQKRKEEEFKIKQEEKKKEREEKLKKLEAERLEKERLEAERLEAERLEKERLALELENTEVVEEDNLESVVITDDEMAILVGDLDKKNETTLVSTSLIDAIYSNEGELSTKLVDYEVEHTESNVNFYKDVVEHIKGEFSSEDISVSDMKSTFAIIDEALGVSSNTTTLEDFDTLLNISISNTKYKDYLVQTLVNQLGNVTLLPIKVKEDIKKHEIPVHTHVEGVQNPIRVALEQEICLVDTEKLDDSNRLEINSEVYDSIEQSGKNYYGFSTEDVIVKIPKDTVNVPKLINSGGKLVVTLQDDFGTQFSLSVTAVLPEKTIDMAYAKKPIQIHLLKQTQGRAYHTSKKGTNTLLQKEVKGLQTVFLTHVVPFVIRDKSISLTDIQESPVPIDIEMAVKLNLMTAIDADTFHCLGNVTKKSLFVWIAKALGYIETKDYTSWYGGSVTYLEEVGVIDSVIKENFDLNTYVLREELCYTLNNIFDTPEVNETAIKDIEQVSELYKGSVQALVNKGVTPLDNEKLIPKDTATREEVAYYLNKIRSLVIKKV